MFSTGPMFVTVQFALHGHKEGLAVLPPHLYGRQSFSHIAGSSWHGSDGKVITWMSCHVALSAGEAGPFLLYWAQRGRALAWLRWEDQHVDELPCGRPVWRRGRALAVVVVGTALSLLAAALVTVLYSGPVLLVWPWLQWHARLKLAQVNLN